ncbi:MAG: glycosyltransferase family 2 protein [Muribaculaceae bacterium]|nr:glycosyltransferase family 2 protein [Muribaculaceae bacterium]
MKVSILIPVYGVEHYIAQCVKSLMEQTYDDIEYIFVDDCTPDNSILLLREVLQDYPGRESQAKVLHHEHNKGLAGARHTALGASTGDAVLFVDSDDYIAPRAVEVLVATMRQQDVDIVDGGFAVVTGGVVEREKMPPHVPQDKYLKTILCQSIEPNRIWGRLIKRSLFEENNIAFTQGVDYGEDFSVLPRLLAFARRGWVDDTLYYYRENNPNSYTNNITSRNAISFLKSQQIVADFVTSGDQWRKYRMAAEVGWVNVWRFARRFGVEHQLVREHFTHEPTHVLTRLLSSIMRSRAPYPVANFLYKAARSITLW